MNWDSNQHCVYLMDVSSKKMHGDAVRPIRIHPMMMMSIILHHYKILKELTSSFIGCVCSSKDNNDDSNINA